MRWEQRKPLWPVVVALGVLFVLALAAPHMWQSLDAHLAPQLAFEALESPVERNAEVASLPPTLMVQPVEALPFRPALDFDAFIQVRDRILAVLEMLPEGESKQAAVVSMPRVRVSSESDRLAMLPPRLHSYPRLSIPQASAKTTKEEEANFAAILLEASRNPKRTPAEVPAVPRLATKPSRPKIPVAVVAPAPQPAVVPQEAPLPMVPTLATSEPRNPPRPVAAPAIRHRPQALINQLEEFATDSPGALWSQEVLEKLASLTESTSTEMTDATKTLDELEQLYRSGLRSSVEEGEPSFSNHWQQTAQALGRRLLLWRMLVDSDQPKIINASSSRAALLPELSKVLEILDAQPNGVDWKEYLLLDQITEATSDGIDTPTLARARLSQEVLSRMADPHLSDAQRKFLATEPLTRLRQELRPWAAGKVNLETLAALLERYELGRESRYGLVIAQLRQRLQWSEDPSLRELAAQLEENYRSANMRLAMSDKLLNRMLPKQEPTVTPVRDRIAGAKVRGRARTTTQLRVRLVPDPNAWRFGLEAYGKIYSDTRSDTWPARVRNAAKMQYQGSKEISLDSGGLQVAPARAYAQGRNDLIGVDSQLDPVPIVGLVLRDLARQKHRRSRPQALSQVKAKVVRQVKQRLDSGLDEKLSGFEESFRNKVLTPMKELAILAEPLDMHTTDHRAVMQLRLANSGQLAAHTLRPLAPSDSVLSLQLHETALNNAMMGLGLDGRRMTMLELFEYLSARFGQADATPPVDMPRRAVIEFASRDSARVRCDGDRLELVMSIAELAHRRDRIKNFQIHVHFRPVVKGLDVRLVREGTLQFSGRRLKTGPRVVLHSVMGKLMVKDQEIVLLGIDRLEEPRLKGLMVTQLVIEDGWIGLALGPAHPRRTAMRDTPFVR